MLIINCLLFDYDILYDYADWWLCYIAWSDHNMTMIPTNFTNLECQHSATDTSTEVDALPWSTRKISTGWNFFSVLKTFTCNLLKLFSNNETIWGFSEYFMATHQFSTHPETLYINVRSNVPIAARRYGQKKKAHISNHHQSISQTLDITIGFDHSHK